MISNLADNLIGHIQIPGVTTTLALTPHTGGAFGGGFLSVGSFYIWITFVILMVVWVALSIYAGIKIMNGGGNPQETEAGITVIRHIWTGVFMFVGFLVGLSVLGSFLGFGSIYTWSDNLYLCKVGYGFPNSDIDPDTRTYYFTFIENELLNLEQDTTRTFNSVTVYCCEQDVVDYAMNVIHGPGWRIVEPGGTDKVFFDAQCEIIKEVDLD
jgi:hypothetical protein